jgi:hypothetical protein
VLSLLDRLQVEPGEGGGRRGADPDAALSRYVEGDLMRAMRESGIAVPDKLPPIVYGDDPEYRDLVGWEERFDHVMSKAMFKYRKQPDFILVLLGKSKNCE